MYAPSGSDCPARLWTGSEVFGYPGREPGRPLPPRRKAFPDWGLLDSSTCMSVPRAASSTTMRRVLTWDSLSAASILGCGIPRMLQRAERNALRRSRAPPVWSNTGARRAGLSSAVRPAATTSSATEPKPYGSPACGTSTRAVRILPFGSTLAMCASNVGAVEMKRVRPSSPPSMHE